jgi:prolyl-tRNA editing enzyme YbaK/EbsC (Cys-tRNA(Pro) deacylase)
MLAATKSFSVTSSHSSRIQRNRRPEMAASSETDATAANSTVSLPVQVSSSLSFSLNPIENASRRAAFDRLCETVLSLAAHKGDDAVQVIPNSMASELSDAIHVNSLVFEVKNSDPILVIVPSADLVDTNKVAELLADKRSSVRLSPANLVEIVCGFPPLSVPPLGHSPCLRTIVDEQLLDYTILWGGGGHPDYSCLVKVETLLNLKHVETADVAVRTIHSAVSGQSKIDGSVELSKPFFPISPPQTLIAEMYANAQEVPNPLQPAPVTIVGRLTGVRRMAKRLVFADLAPPDYSTEDDYPWRSGLDGAEMAVQLIAGKTFCKALGEVAAPAALRGLKPGQLALIKGKTNVDNRDSLHNWVTKRSLDIVVSSYQLLEEPQETKLGNAISNAELRRLQLAATVQPPPPPPSIEKRVAPPDSQTSATSYLTLNDVFPSENNVPPVTLVDSIESVNDFAGKISHLLLSLTTSKGHSEDADIDANEKIPGMDKIGLIGVDCEWKPSFMMISPNEPQPILLLQISIRALKQVFLFDAQALFRPLRDPSETMTELEEAASDTLLDLFSSRRLLKVGFQVSADLRRLASSYPHIPAFRVFHSVVEVSTFAKKAMQMSKTRNVKYHTTSLSRVTEFLVGKTIDKGQQVSDWGIRPMSEEQIEYAALDAAVSPLLLEKSLQMANAGVVFENSSKSSTVQLGRWEDDSTFTRSVLSWRFLLLDTNDPRAITKLKAKRVVGEPYVVTQRWATGDKPPMLPTVPSGDGDGPYTDVSGVFRIPSNLVRITAGKDTSSLVDHLVGHRVGRSKEKCVESLLTGEAALPRDAKIEFHQRSGYVEFEDGAALFVNMPDKSYKRGYPNEWLEGGKIMTWYLKESDWNGGTSVLAQKLTGMAQKDLAGKASAVISNESADEMSTLGRAPSVAILFVRMAKGEFLCCGRCHAFAPRSHEAELETLGGVEKVGDWGLVQLQLELFDWEKLQPSEEFVGMVQDWLGNGESYVSRKSEPLAANLNKPMIQKPELAKLDSEPPKINALTEIVLAGNIVGAMTVALKQRRVPLKDRSVARGMETLKQELENDASEDSLKALQLIQGLDI